jgi:hypothetical protein
MGIIVNFTNNTVHGFGNPDPKYGEDFPVKITGVNEVTISFQGERQDKPNAVTSRRIIRTLELLADGQSGCKIADLPAD